MTVTVLQKKRVFARDQERCLIQLPVCTWFAQTTDHRANRGQGGAGDVLDAGCNLIGACVLCNTEKENTTGAARRALITRGIIVIPDSTHRKTLERVKVTPVLLIDGRRFRLIDHDTRELVAA